MRNYLIISAVGQYRSDIVNELSKACIQCGCNVQASKMNMLGKEICISLFVSGNWGAIAKMEASLPLLEQRLGLTLVVRRTSESPSNLRSMSYTVQVQAIDKPGILNGISDFLYRLSVPIEEISAQTYLSHTSTWMATLTFKINVPENLHLASFREQFMSYCDEQNLDAFLEPTRLI